MYFFGFLSKSRGSRNLYSRIGTVLKNFGISPKKFKILLDRYCTVTEDLGCISTFPVTASVMKRHLKLIRELGEQGIELAVHGYVHTDYGVVSLENQVVHYKKAINTFQKYQIPYTGFRAPFLRINENTIPVLNLLNFSYDSSYIINWDVFDKAMHNKSSWDAYQRLLNFYKPRRYQDFLSVPKYINNVLEIPVSIPDDELMIERLGITDAEEITKIWMSILTKTYKNGELFTIQAHPERILIFENALVDVIQKAKTFSPAVWFTTLGEIANWWKEKNEFRLEIFPEGNGKYRVKSDCTKRATLLLKNCRANIPVKKWFEGYDSVDGKEFIIECESRPVIGVGANTSQDAINFLKNEGFIVESSSERDDYAIYLDDLANFQEIDEKTLYEKIEKSNVPLIRYWRWPNGARSALSLTGDIDSITLSDFALRILENLFLSWKIWRPSLSKKDIKSIKLVTRKTELAH
jgi:hypothetical protein